MDRKHSTKKKWNQDKVDGFLAFIESKLKITENQAKKKQYFGLFIKFLKNDNFKQTILNCSPHSRVSLAIESLLHSEGVMLDELLLLGRSLCKQLFYADVLEKLVLCLFQKYLNDDAVVEFLKTVWFDEEIICELPNTWSMYVKKWPSYLESHIMNILKSVHSQEEGDNIWNQSGNHFLIKMSCRREELFQHVCDVLNAMFIESELNTSILYVIRQFVESVTDYCVRSNKDIVDLYPRFVQASVMCCTLDLLPQVGSFAESLPSNWKFILSTHHPKLTGVLLREKTCPRKVGQLRSFECLSHKS